MTVALRGARVLLTGATGGLGHAIAHALHARGASLVLTGRQADVLGPLAAELSATPVVADLSDPAAVGAVVEQSGDVDVLVANAALPSTGMLEDFDEADLDRQLDVNLRAPIVLAHALLPSMVARGRGQVVMIGSVSGLVASPGSAMYNASKFGLRGFAGGLRQDLHGTGVGVSLVMPGFVRDAGMFAKSGMVLPPGVRTVSPQQVADAVARAIEKDQGEVVVAPAELRLGAKFGQLAPGINAAIQRRAGAADIVGGHQGGN
ncbi:MAG: SDR family NAD(P)-dependent oxidoreductase [Marmoricola sp.]